MPWFDPDRNCYVIRIVYDGPGFAGKTTNLKRICDLVPSTRRTEIYTPGELKGRTMFFDWLELDGPSHETSPIRFQLITVPGQEQRNYRRRPLVEMADVVVFVADTSAEQLADSQRTFARLRVSMNRRVAPLPFLVQANKQDTADALGPEELRRRLRLQADVPILPASAKAGDGVKETLMAAMRLGVEQLRGVAVATGTSALGDADALFDHVLAFEDNPQNEEPVGVEELHLGAEDEIVDEEALAAQLGIVSLESLQERARRATESPPADPSAPDYLVEDRQVGASS